VANIYVATRSFSTVLDGASRVIQKGATVREGHPLLDGRDANFKLLVPTFEHKAPARPAPVVAPAKKAAPAPLKVATPPAPAPPKKADS
jgi:hypothetical protein